MQYSLEERGCGDVWIVQSVNYTAFCVLTDVDMKVTVDSGWHPSHLDVFDPLTKSNRIILFRHNRDCAMSTNLTLTADKQVGYDDHYTRHTLMNTSSLVQF